MTSACVKAHAEREAPKARNPAAWIRRYENAVTAVLWMRCGAATALPYKPTMLISAGADGVVRVWRVAAEGRLMCTLEGAVGPLDTVKALCTDAEHVHLVVADSSGHVKVLHVPDLNATAPEKTMASFSQVRC